MKENSKIMKANLFHIFKLLIIAVIARIRFMIKAKRFILNFNQPFLFDKNYYLNENPDVKNSGLDPFYHYYNFGWKEGRNPNPFFEVKTYFQSNLSILDDNFEPLTHYMTHGWRENRLLVDNLRTQNCPMDEVGKMLPPTFIVGVPRSGTSYLLNVMNHHELIFITDEFRVMSFINDLFRNFLTSDRMDWILRGRYRQDFLAFFRAEMAGLIKRFYLGKMNRIQTVWGDKHPHYTDSSSDPGAMDTILEVFPDARIIHIYRNPRNVIHSNVLKGWKTFSEAVQQYKDTFTNARGLRDVLGDDRYHEIRYEDLVENGRQEAVRLCEFLKIPESERLMRFMEQQQQERTPFSKPITDLESIGKHIEQHFSTEEEKLLDQELGVLIRELGYS